MQEEAKYKSVPVERVYPESGQENQIEDLLGDDLLKLSGLLTLAGVSAPANLTSRVMIVPESVYQIQRSKESDKGHTEVGFTSNLTGISYISSERADSQADEWKMPRNDVLRSLVIHEMFHTLENKSDWIQVVEEREIDRQVRRSGIGNFRPKYDREDVDKFVRAEGLQRLNEGIVQFLTYGVTRVPAFAYKGEVEIVSGLAEPIGIDVLVRVITTKKGLIEFVRKFNAKLGNGALDSLAYIMGEAYLDAQKNAAKGFEEEVDYSDLLALFRKAAAERQSTSAAI